MRRTLNLAWLNLLQIAHDRGELLSILFLPILLTSVFGMAMGGGAGQGATKVVFVDQDGTAYSRRVGELLAEERSLSVEATDRAHAASAVKGPFDAAVMVPKGFGAAVKGAGRARIEVLQDPSRPEAYAVGQVADGIAKRMAGNALAARLTAEEIDAARAEFVEKPLPVPPSGGGERLHPAAAEASRAAQAPPPPPVPVKDLPPEVWRGLTGTFPYIAHGPAFETLYERADEAWEPEPPVSVKRTVVRASAVRGDSTQAEGFGQYSLGFTVMFILFIAVGSAGGIIEEREIGTLSRLMMTPASKAQLLLGKIFGVAVTASFEAAILIGLGAFVFKVPWGRDPVALLAVLAPYVLAATGLSVLLTALVRTRGQLSAVGNMSVVALAMLGGCYWPIDIVSPVMRGIAQVTPTGWAMAGLTDVVVRNQGVASAMTPALVLLGFAAVFFVLGLRLLKFE